MHTYSYVPVTDFHFFSFPLYDEGLTDVSSLGLLTLFFIIGIGHRPLRGLNAQWFNQVAGVVLYRVCVVELHDRSLYLIHLNQWAYLVGLGPWAKYTNATVVCLEHGSFESKILPSKLFMNMYFFQSNNLPKLLPWWPLILNF